MHEQAEAMTGTPVQTPTAAVTMLAVEEEVRVATRRAACEY
jgi:hypothetical protein